MERQGWVERGEGWEAPRTSQRRHLLGRWGRRAVPRGRKELASSRILVSSRPEPPPLICLYTVASSSDSSSMWAKWARSVGTRAPLRWAGTSLPPAWLLLYPKCWPRLWALHPPSARPVLSRDGSMWGAAGSSSLFRVGLSRMGSLSFPSQTSEEEAACAFPCYFLCFLL